MTHSAAQKLALCFHNVNTDRSKDSMKFLDHISEIFENFVLSDSLLRAQIASREVLKCIPSPRHLPPVVWDSLIFFFSLLDIVRELENLPPEQLLKMLKNIRALSGDVTTLEGIQKSGAIHTFIKFLERRSGKFLVEICTTVMVIMYNFCKISKKRQEFVATNGIVPHLIYFSSSKRDGPTQLGTFFYFFFPFFLLLLQHSFILDLGH